MFATPIAVTAPAVPQAKVEAAHEPHLASLDMFFHDSEHYLQTLSARKLWGQKQQPEEHPDLALFKLFLQRSSASVFAAVIRLCFCSGHPLVYLDK